MGLFYNVPEPTQGPGKASVWRMGANVVHSTRLDFRRFAWMRVGRIETRRKLRARDRNNATTTHNDGRKRQRQTAAHIRLHSRPPGHATLLGTALLLLLLLLDLFNGLFYRTTWVSQYQKGKTSLDLNEARDDGVLGCSGTSWTIRSLYLAPDR